MEAITKQLNYPKETIQNVFNQQKSSSTIKFKLSFKQRYSLWLDRKIHSPSGKLIILDGSRSFGLVTDKVGVPCNSNSPNRLSYLQELKSSILSIGRLNIRFICGLKEEHFETLKMNIVKGTCTLKHTCYFFLLTKIRKTIFELVIQTWSH